MNAQRPDLNGLPADVVAYIEELEAQLQIRGEGRQSSHTAAQPDEEPTTKAIITVSRLGAIKRTPRHLFSRQRRGGMGVFDIDIPDDDAPVCLAHVDSGDMLVLLTDDGRAFRLPGSALAESPVRARGRNLRDILALRQQEKIIGVLPEGGGAYAILLSKRGWVRRISGSYFGKNLIPGSSFHDLKEGGPLVAACWSNGTGDLFIASREGKAIRFLEKQVPARGCLGMRLDPTDEAVAVAAVGHADGVFLIGEDGQGTIRLMSGFAANKAPAAGGKVAMKTGGLVGVVKVSANDDLFVISRMGKLIRFTADEVPPKEGVVQGVACMALRADEAVAVTVSPGS